MLPLAVFVCSRRREIDVELNNPTTEIIERAVELANNVIWEDRAIAIRSVTSGEAAELSLRKEPA